LKKISFNIFVFFSIILFCSLGTWQIYRLQWKLELINQIKKGLDSEIIYYSKSNIKNYQKVKFNGVFDFKKQIYLYSLNEKGAPGFDIITPMKINTNEILLINRGWIKKDLKHNKDINLTSANNFEGIIKKITKSNPFKPDNDLKKNIWFSLNIDELRSYTGLEVSEYVIYVQNKDNQLIKPRKIDPNLPNNHLKYALTWYSVALSILIYFLYFRKKQ
tara:strand:- start:318 stop:971 length:654 start_codon:yes stop_codon:yes gene_type:complete